MSLAEIEQLFASNGGAFHTSAQDLQRKLGEVKALVFDWDGVWHSGRKDGSGASSFSEVDSMGLNMLRFGYYLRNGVIPYTCIVTGERNTTAFDLAQREHMDAVLFKAKNKLTALQFLQDKWQLQSEQVLFAFDDILDLGLAAEVGVRYLVQNQGSVLFGDFVRKAGWVDYATGADGGNNAVRELSELSLGVLGLFEKVVEKRMQFDAEYATYWEKRNNQKVEFYSLATGRVEAVEF